MRARVPALTIALAALAIVAAACGGGGSHAHASVTTSRHVSSTTTTAAPSTTRITTAPASSTSATAPKTPATVAVTTTPTTVAPPSPTTAAPQSLLVTRASGVGSAEQVIIAAADGYGTSRATLTAYQHNGAGWSQVFGPWIANIGRNGVAPAGAKREGDGRTPSGAFGFDFMFGVNPNPGVKFPFRPIAGSNIVWDDDPASPNYNEWIDTNTANAGVRPEPMYVGAYGSGAVIAYNGSRTPGLGSAIFLHLSSGGSTAGCVSLPSTELLPLLRWLDPTRAPRIIIGTLAAITS